MKFKRVNVICFLIALFFSLAHAGAEDEVAIEFERFSERVLIVKAGKVYTDQVAAIASEKGLIVIDTGKASSLTVEYRKIIEREFGRSDFAYVINTHYHFDHTDGNQVFADVIIIAHERSPEGMRRFEQNRLNFVATRRNQQMVQLENQLKALDPDSEQAQRLRDILYTGRIMLDDLENKYVLTLPTMTFSDRMTLDLGDLTLKLIYFGEGRHAGDDIVIHCPEEKLLFTGDLFYKGSMAIAFSSEFDAPRWIEVMNEVLQDEDRIEWVYDCHNGRMPRTFVALWRDYLVEMWEGLNAAREDGLNFDAVQDRFSYDKRFTYLEKSGLETAQLQREHQDNLRYIWLRVNESQSAAMVLERVISQAGTVGAAEKYREMKSAPRDKFYFDENEMNRLGYRLLGQDKTAVAIEVFKMNVELYPDSWNVYDSLGEGYMNDGQRELAIKNFEKSLKLNPENENAKEMLKRIEVKE
jgi:glyoxylase-like metal-dependent hydrolase (beta-lactamase superfamily II)